MKLHPFLEKETDLIMRMWNEVTGPLAWMWKSIFINQLMFLTHCRSGQCFRKRLETVRALSFILAASARTALNFMLGELLATGLGPQTRGNHWMTSKLTFGKVLSFLNHRNFFFTLFFRIRRVHAFCLNIYLLKKNYHNLLQWSRKHWFVYLSNE